MDMNGRRYGIDRAYETLPGGFGDLARGLQYVVCNPRWKSVPGVLATEPERSVGQLDAKD
jgi:hypothetical protein